MDSLIIAVGLLVSIVGLVGCILPVIPGPPISFAALLILAAVKDWQVFSASFLVGMGLLALLVSLLDYVVPALGARRFGASKQGVWGSVLGMLAGVVFFPPWGILLGGFAGAVLGEMSAGKEGPQALRAGWGVFLGTVAATGLKLAASGFMLFSYVAALF